MAELLPIITAKDVHSVRAVMAGTANAEQQTTAMKWILEQVCRRYDNPYLPGIDQVQLGVLLGRHYAGVVINQMLSPNVLAKAQAYDAEQLRARLSGATTPATPTTPRPQVRRERQK